MLNAKKKLASSQLNNTSDNIIHLFTTKRLTPEQEHDLVNIGQEEFENYYTLKILTYRHLKGANTY